MINKPFLRINKVGNNTYLACAVKDDKDKTKTIKSFGNACIPDNWDKCIAFVLDEQKSFYIKQKNQFLHVQ